MKQPYIRVEITKGDASKKTPWKRTVRIIERDGTTRVSAAEFENVAELLAVLKVPGVPWLPRD